MQDSIRNELANIESINEASHNHRHYKTPNASDINLQRFQYLLQEHQDQQLNMLNELCLISNLIKVSLNYYIITK